MIDGLAKRLRRVFGREVPISAVAECLALWGEAQILSRAPKMQLVENAIYIPWSHGGPWGVFDANNEIVPEAVNYRLPQDVPSGPMPEFPSTISSEIDILNTALYIGFINVHFGHFIIESVSRFWPFLGDAVDMPLICHARGAEINWEPFPFIGAILAGLGVGVERLTVPDRPLRIRRLWIACPSFQEQAWAYPIFRTMCKKIGSPFWDPSEVDCERTPVYLSKSKLPVGLGRLAQEEIIEKVLRAAGIDIIYPETIAFAELVNLQARRKVILATAGSSLHASIFSAPKRCIRAINLSGYVNANFTLIDKLNENDASYYCTYVSHIEVEENMKLFYVVEPQAVAKDLITLAKLALA